MSGDLQLSVLSKARDELGYIAGFAITDQMIVALGGISTDPTVLATSNTRDFELRATPKGLGLRDVLAVADSIWACGEWGQLAVSRDHGGTWKLIETKTSGCLFSVALGFDGALWVVGDEGYAARVLGPRLQQVDLATKARLSAAYAVRDEIVVLGFDGLIRRWRDGKVTVVPCGATRPLTSLVVTAKGTWIVTGDGGFIARSPDGQWFSRATSGVDADLESSAALRDGTLLVVGDRGQILRSVDDGRTWRAVPNELGSVHLWSIERFEDGVLLGGDDGLIARLGPPGESAWADRPNLLGGPKRLDDAFAAGPDGFIERGGLVAYLEGIATAEEEEEEVDADEDEDDEEDDDEGDEDDAAAETDEEAERLLSGRGDAHSFQEVYGVPLPAEAASFFDAVDGRDKWKSFVELGLDRELRSDVGPHNLFELLVRRDQHARGGTDLAEMFAGVFAIGSLSDGDTYHLELYEWGGPRQVLTYDPEERAFEGVIADSLDSLVYLAALAKAGARRRIADKTLHAGLRSLYGKVAPPWSFEIEERDGDFEALETERRDSDVFFQRARWIVELLRNDVELDDVPDLFDAELNEAVDPEALPAHFAVCERFVPHALYAMWRAYFFDEAELDRYLEIGRLHKARLVRDSARLIQELRQGRNELGTIGDVRAHVRAFRALELDPRRAEASRLEAEARTQAESGRRAAVVGELEGAPAERWRELAWHWLGDGAAHRALLERLDVVQGSQIAALDELRELGDDEREAALPQLAAELSPELEAVLVGSLVRDDDLGGVLVRPTSGNGESAHARDEEDEDVDDRAPGWDAIDEALAPIYAGVEPMHFGTALPYALGGHDPIHGISAYPRSEPVPHWHFVTYGFTDLFLKEHRELDESGFGFELTLRLARKPDDARPPMWALVFLQDLGRYVFGSGNRFAAGHKMGLHGPIGGTRGTKIEAICFAEDPELGEITSEYGKARFLQVVGITGDEYRLVQEWSTTGLIDILKRQLPHLVTDLGRGSVLDDPATAAQVEQRVAEEGSSEDLTYAGNLIVRGEGSDGVRIELGAVDAAALPRAMRGRLRHGRPYALRGREATLRLEPATESRVRRDGDDIVLELTEPLAREIEVQLAPGLAGTYRFTTWPGLEIAVAPTLRRRSDGEIEALGVADPVEARRLVEAEKARLAAEARARGEVAEEEDRRRIGDDEDDGEAVGQLDDDDDAEAAGQLDEDDDGEAAAVGQLDEDDDGEAVDEDEDGEAVDEDEDAEAVADDDDDEYGTEEYFDDDDDEDDDERRPDPERIEAATGMTERALRLAPDEPDVQFTHAMLLLDADRAGVLGKADELLAWLPRFSPPIRINVAVRLGRVAHARFGDAVELALGDTLPDKIFSSGSTAVGGGAMMMSFGDVAHELFGELGDAILEHAPAKMARLVPLLPEDVGLLSQLAWKSFQADQRDVALGLYDRLLGLPIPNQGDDRTNYLRALNNACVQAHAAKAYDAAARIADRAQPVAHENPYIFHSAACAYAALGDLARAFDQVKLAVEHDYDHLRKIEVDTDLGRLLEWPEFQALFRDWHARQESN